MPGACYPAHRRLPGRDLHPLRKRSEQRAHRLQSHLERSSRHDAPCKYATPGDEAAHERHRRRECERARHSLRRLIETTDENPAPILIIRGDHGRATFPGTRARLRLEEPRGGALLELTQARRRPSRAAARVAAWPASPVCVSILRVISSLLYQYVKTHFSTPCNI